MKGNYFNVEVISKIAVRSGKLFLTHKKKLNAIFNVILVSLFIFSIWHFRTVLLTSIHLAMNIGWYLFFLPLLFLFWNCSATLAWLKILKNVTQFDNVNFWKLYLIRIQSQALNLVLPLFGMGGEVLRTLRTSDEYGMKKSVVCVTSDKITDIFSEGVLALIGAVFASSFLPGHDIIFSVSLFLTIISFIILLYLEKIIPILTNVWLKRFGKELNEVVNNNPKFASALRVAFFHHLNEHILMGIEIYCISFLLGIRLGITEILLVNTVSTLFNLAFIFIPGRLGAYECSVAFAFNLLSLQPEAGVSVALLRRARQLIVCGVGILLVSLHRKKNRYHSEVYDPIMMA